VLAGVLLYTEVHRGLPGVAELLRRADLPWTLDELRDQTRWFSYDTRLRVYRAAAEVFDDPDITFRIGAAAMRSGMAHSLVLLLRALGSPRAVYRQLPRAAAKFITTSRTEVVELGATSATIRLTLADGLPHDVLDCRYGQGMTSIVPTVFGLPPAEIVESVCAADGGRTCTYRLTWDRRRRLRRPRRHTDGVDPELAALRGQLRILQSAATDLVASDDVDTALRRIVARAAEAVLAPAYLLAVTTPGGGPTLVHSAGVPEDQVPGMAATLLAGGELGAGTVVVDVASARHRYGRLAAINGPGGGVADERTMLAAYAGHAAAALDLLLALDGARAEADRAGALLHLAHALSAAEDAASVARVVAEVLPRVVGCSSSGVFLWDPTRGALRPAASAGLLAEHESVLRSLVLHAEEVPELVAMLTDREPRHLDPATGSGPLRDLMTRLDLGDAVAVPLVAGNAFLGVVTASWSSAEAADDRDPDVLARLRGLGDQASSALQKARLLDTVRHQATHDSLTGLPNRRLFGERLSGALAAASPSGAVGVLFCDLDRFKAVNDTLGHAAGDELLRQVSARLRAAVRPGDTVGRLSGDEFAVLLPRLGSAADAEAVVARVAAAFDEPFRLDGTPVTVGTSTGVAVHAGGGGSAEDLLREADAAMYRHKRRDRPAAPAPQSGD
jgi:diguanylate cyclase (GGDEF)-like protein